MDQVGKTNKTSGESTAKSLFARRGFMYISGSILRKVRGFQQIFCICTLCLLPLLFGCTARGPHFRQVDFDNEPDFLIYIYRPFTTFQQGSGDIPVLYIDENKVGGLPIGGYQWVKIEPGKHKFEVKKTILFGLAEAGPVAGADIESEKSGVYYVRYSHDFEGFTIDYRARSTHDLVVLPWEQAQPEIIRTHFVGKKTLIE